MTRWLTVDRFLLMLGFTLMTAYWPWSGAATTPRWCVLALACVALPLFEFTGRWTDPPPRLTWGHIVGGAFVLWATASWWWSVAPYDTNGALLGLVIFVAVFMLGARVDNLGPFWVGAALGIGVNSALVVLDLLGVIAYEQYSRPSGLFVNGLYLAEVAVLVLVGLWPTAWGRGPGLILTLPSILLVSVARGPLLALGVCLVGWLWSRMRWMALICTATMLIGGAVAFAYRPSTVTLRLEMWGDAIESSTAIGHGFGTYFQLAPLISSRFDQGRNVEMHPHNVFVEILFELGLPGLLLALAFYMLICIPGRARPVLCAFLIEACFGFPLSLPSTGGVLALVAGNACRDLRPWRDALGRGRDGICGGTVCDRSSGQA